MCDYNVLRFWFLFSLLSSTAKDIQGSREFQGLNCDLTVGRQGMPAYQLQCYSLWALPVDRIKIKFTSILLQNWPCYFFMSASDPVNICTRNQ